MAARKAAPAAGPKPETVGLRELNRATLARQVLLAREAMSPPAVLERLVGLQAQWTKPPFVGLWSRIAGFRRADLSALLRERKVVRAGTMRGTLHLLTTADYLTFRSAFQPVLARGFQGRGERTEGVDVAKIVEVGRPFFAAGPRTFTELRDLLATLDLGDDIRMLAFAVRTHVPLVQVPTDAPWAFPTDPDFTLDESWLGKTAAPADGTTLETLVLRYLAAFGPATPADMQTWSGLQALRGVFTALEPRLLKLRDERGRTLYDLPDAPRPPADTPAPVRFLPEFDNLVLGHADRTRFVADEHRAAVFLPGLRVAPTLLVDGFVAGTWKVAATKKETALVVTPFAPLAKAVRAEVEEEGGRLIEFLGEEAPKRTVRID